LKSTIVVHRTFVKAFIRNLNGKPFESITDSDVREFLSRYNEKSPYTYANALKAMKIFVGVIGRASGVFGVLTALTETGAPQLEQNFAPAFSFSPHSSQ
jgi:hypothetical protein